MATEWDSGNGGLSTLNRQLCRALVAAGCRVVCVTLDDASREVDGVSVVAAKRTPGQPDHEALARRPALPAGFVPDVIIGHSRVTGPAAKILAEDHFPGAKRLHVVHMAPDEIEWLKPDRSDDAGTRAEDRTRIEIELGRMTSHVVAIGPRLHARFEGDLAAHGIAAPIRLDPGFDALEVTPRTPPPGRPWKVLLLGRLEDWEIKGLDLAARAVGAAVKGRDPSLTQIELIVRGAPAGTSAELRKQLVEWAAAPGLDILVRPYTTDLTRLDADLRGAILVLMPSRSEGFGLVGLEAIVAGTPVLVSGKSGLGELLREVLDAEQAARLVVPVTSGGDDDVARWAAAIERVLSNRDAAFRDAEEVRERLGRDKTWAAAAAQLLAALRS